MAFPSVRSFTTTNGTTASATPAVNLPSPIAAGDTIFVVFQVAVAGAIGWPDASWVEMFDASPAASDDQWAGAWRKADGTEGATITLTCTSGKFCAIAFAVQDATDPTIRPPELSTVATGSATQPDATTCTPTGGAKDYLWLTFFGMEGEQTGITTYPTSYTLAQTGLANSGTAGAVTTNCTMAGAARQLNASSQDAGAWTVGGTLDDWSAYTIAFHPAEAIGAPLQTEWLHRNPEPRKSAPIDALNFGVNLLQTTLKPPDPPFFQSAWPNPAPIPARLQVVINTRPVEVTAPIVPVDQPLPQGKPFPVDLRTWTQNLQETTLAPPPPDPRVQTDWPNPQGKPHPKKLRTWLVGIQPPDDTPVVPVLLRVPRPTSPPLALRTWVWNNLTDTLQPTEGAPFTQEDWPLVAPPKRLGGALRSWTNALTTTTLAPVASPFNQEDWPLIIAPKRLGGALRTWTNALTTTTLATPFSQEDWPLVPAPKSLVGLRTLAGPRFIGLVEPLPDGRQQDWPLPRAKGRGDLSGPPPNLLVTTFTTPPSPPPGLLEDWPNPAALKAFRLALQQASVGRFAGLVDPLPTGRLLDWPLPAPRAAFRTALRQDWSHRFLGLVEPQVNPFGLDDWPLPLAAVRVNKRGIIDVQGNPILPLLFVPPGTVIDRRMELGGVGFRTGWQPTLSP